MWTVSPSFRLIVHQINTFWVLIPTQLQYVMILRLIHKHTHTNTHTYTCIWTHPVSQSVYVFVVDGPLKLFNQCNPKFILDTTIFALSILPLPPIHTHIHKHVHTYTNTWSWMIWSFSVCAEPCNLSLFVVICPLHYFLLRLITAISPVTSSVIFHSVTDEYIYHAHEDLRIGKVCFFFGIGSEFQEVVHLYCFQGSILQTSCYLRTILSYKWS